MLRDKISINKKLGDTITVSYMDSVVLELYKHFNALIPDDVSVITSGQFIQKNTGSFLPNYCGSVTTEDTAYSMNTTSVSYGLTDSIIAKLSRDIDETVAKITFYGGE